MAMEVKANTGIRDIFASLITTPMRQSAAPAYEAATFSCPLKNME
jgi:hypothetical protein